MKKIYFRADAGAGIGYGHFIRSLALADMLKSDFECVMFTQEPTPYQVAEAEKVCQLVALPADESRFDMFLTYLTGDEIVVLDNYFFTTEYQQQIKDIGCKLVCIDDMHDRHFVADVIVNHGECAAEEYDTEAYTRLCIGDDWRLIRKEFMTHYAEKLLGNWLISFGGTDFCNLTERFTRILQEDDRVRSISVVVGDAYMYSTCLESYPKAKVYSNISAKEMAALMQKAEYAIVPCSSVCVEALTSGCKVGTGYFVDNQVGGTETMRRNRYAVILGDLRTCEKGSVVDAMVSYEYSKSPSFDHVAENYVKLFKYLCDD